MATYVNNLRLTELATGEGSGTWGTTTNTNLELIGEALGYGSEAVANASTHTITVADGTADSARSFYLKLTGGGQACTVTLAPNTLSKVWMVENTTNSTLTFSQGSGANVAIAAGAVKMIATDGAGSGAVVYDLLVDTDLTGTTTVVNLTSSGTIDAATVEFNSLSGTGSVAITDILDQDNMSSNSATALATQQSIKAYVDSSVASFDTLAEVLAQGNTTGSTDIEVTTAQKVQFRDSAIYINSSADGQLDIVADTEIQIAATTIDVNGNVDVSGTIAAGGVVTANAGVVVDNITIDGTEIDLSSGDLTLDVAGDIILDAGGGDWAFNDDGVTIGTFANVNSGDFRIRSHVADKDIFFMGLDGSSTITALTLDMSDGGEAYFAKNIHATSAFLTTANNDPQLTLISTDADASSGPVIKMYRNSGSPADSDQVGRINFTGRNDNSQDVDYARIITQIKDASDGTEDGRLAINTMVAGDIYSRINIIETETVFNDESLDLDFRVESDGNTHMLFVDAGTNQVGINRSSFLNSTVRLEVGGADNVPLIAAEASGVRAGMGVSSSKVGFYHNATSVLTISSAGKIETVANGVIETASSAGSLTLHGGATNKGGTILLRGGNSDSDIIFKSQASTATPQEVVRIGPSEMVVNEGSLDYNFRVESDGNANMLFVDAGNNRVGIGLSSPTRTLHIADNSADPFVLVDGSAGNRDSGFSINAGAGQKIAIRGDAGGTLFYGNENQMSTNSTGVVFNESSADLDFRVESNNNGHMLFVDGGNDVVVIGGTTAETADTFEVISSDTNTNVRIRNTNAGDAGPRLIFDKASASAANDDNIGELLFIGKDSSGNAEQFARLLVESGNVTSGAEDGVVSLEMMVNGTNTQMYVHNHVGTTFNEGGDGDLDFRVESDSNTHAVFVDASTNRVGILNNNPAYAFHVDAEIASSGYYRVDSSGTYDGTALLTLKRNGNTTGDYIQMRDGSNNVFATFDEGGIIFNEIGGDTDFRVESDAYSSCLHVNAGDNSVNFHKAATSVSTSGFTIGVPSSGVTSSMPSGNTYHVYRSDGVDNGYKFYVNFGGQINSTSTSISSLSDERLKENIVDLETGLSEVMALKPRRFDWKNSDNKNVAGFIAQEVETILPELIGDFLHDDLADAKSVKMGDMVPTLVKAIQEQQTLIETLTARITALENA